MWKFAVGMSLSIVYGLYPYNGDFAAITPGWLNDLYQSTLRFVWSLTLAWISYACLTGWGGEDLNDCQNINICTLKQNVSKIQNVSLSGFINTLLSLKIWEPLSRLCFLAYLIHPIVIGLFYMNLKQTMYFNEWIIVSRIIYCN